MNTSAHSRGPLVYRQRLLTRLTHWIWAVSLFFLLLTGLQIFNAHPALYWGQESGFDYNNAVLALSGREAEDGLRGVTWVLGQEFDTTGVLGASGGQVRGFPSWATIPSHHDLGTGRVIHFFFAWVLFGTLLLWLVASLLNGHLREVLPRPSDLRALPGDVLNHARLRFHRRTSTMPRRSSPMPRCSSSCSRSYSSQACRCRRPSTPRPLAPRRLRRPPVGENDPLRSPWSSWCCSSSTTS
jgi:thiosulfate reductase cytochrome b subunit